MSSARATACAALLAAALLAVFLLAAPTPATAFLGDLDPFADTLDEFDGKFVDTLEPGPWVPPLERIMHEQNARARKDGASATFGRTQDDWTDNQAAEQLETAAEEPVALADGLTLLRMDRPGLVESPALDAYLQGIVARLQAQSPVTAAPIRVYVTSENGYGQAGAMPDGAIGLPIATLRQVDSEDELAFVLAHEMAHVLLGHHDSDWFADARDSLVTTAEIGLGLAIAVGSQVGQGSEIAGEALKILMIAQGVMFATDHGLFPSWNREQEDEADLLGFDLMIRAGYNFQGAFDVMAKLERWEAELAARPDPRQAKLEELDRQIAQSGSSGQFSEAIQGVVARVSIDIGEALEDIGGEDHRSATDRFDSLSSYVDREYGDHVPPASRSHELTEVRKSTEVATLFEAYRDADRAYADAEAGKLASAEAAARRATGGAMSHHAWPRYAFHKTRLAQGNLDKAAQNLELALRGERPTLVVYKELADLYWRDGRQAESLALLLRAHEQFSRPPALYADLIYRYQQSGRTQEANALVLECRYRDRKAGKVCQSAAEGRAPGEPDTSGGGAGGGGLGTIGADPITGALEGLFK